MTELCACVQNRGNCDGFLRDYGLLPPSPKQTEHLVELLLIDVHNAIAVFNAVKSPAKREQAHNPDHHHNLVSSEMYLIDRL